MVDFETGILLKFVYNSAVPRALSVLRARFLTKTVILNTKSLSERQDTPLSAPQSPYTPKSENFAFTKSVDTIEEYPEDKNPFGEDDDTFIEEPKPRIQPERVVPKRRKSRKSYRAPPPPKGVRPFSLILDQERSIF